MSHYKNIVVMMLSLYEIGKLRTLTNACLMIIRSEVTSFQFLRNTNDFTLRISSKRNPQNESVQETIIIQVESSYFKFSVLFKQWCSNQSERIIKIESFKTSRRPEKNVKGIGAQDILHQNVFQGSLHSWCEI